MIRRIFTAGFLATLISCSDNSNTADVNAPEKDSSVSETMQPTKALRVKDDNLNAIYQHYIHLTTALINANFNEAKLAANAIETGAKELNPGTNLAAAATTVSIAGDIEAQRTAYSALSNEMITLIKQAGVENGELYVDYCPMAMDDKGASWISESKEIRNPYFGDKMMNCGEVKEVIR